MSVNLEYYRIFYFAAKYGSFTQAARILDSSQPNVTRTMNNLEAALGCRLFVRSRKGVSLTPEGERLFGRIETAYEEILAGENELLEARLLVSGSLSVAVSEIALHALMLPVLQRFKAAHPLVRIQLFNHSAPQAVRALETGMAELAVVSTPAGASGTLRETRLLPFQDVLIAGRSFRALAGREVSLKEAASFPLVTLSRETGSYQFLSGFFAANGLVLEPAVEAATTDQVLPLVRYDIGLGFVPEEMAEAALREEAVFPVRLRERIPERQIVLIEDKSRPLSGAALALKNEILRGRSPAR